MPSCKLKFYIGPASRFSGVKIERTEKVCDTLKEVKAWIEEQAALARADKRDWPVRGYTFKRVRHYTSDTRPK